MKRKKKERKKTRRNRNEKGKTKLSQKRREKPSYFPFLFPSFILHFYSFTGCRKLGQVLQKALSVAFLLKKLLIESSFFKSTCAKLPKMTFVFLISFTSEKKKKKKNGNLKFLTEF